MDVQKELRLTQRNNDSALNFPLPARCHAEDSVLKFREKVGLNSIFPLNLWFICANKTSSKCEWIQFVFLSLCLKKKKKNILVDEISQQLSNPVPLYFMWNGNEEFHISFEKQENTICTYNVTIFFSDLFIYLIVCFLNCWFFTIVWSGDMSK